MKDLRICREFLYTAATSYGYAREQASPSTWRGCQPNVTYVPLGKSKLLLRNGIRIARQCREILAEIRAHHMILAAPTLVLGALVTSAGGLQVGRAGARPPTRHRVPLASAAPPLALLFDCDGVLADTERDGHRVSFNRVFGEKSLGFEWGVEQYGKLCEVGGGKERMTAHFNVVGWPMGYENPTTTDLEKPKGLPKDPERLALVK